MRRLNLAVHGQELSFAIPKLRGFGLRAKRPAQMIGPLLRVHINQGWKLQQRLRKAFRLRSHAAAEITKNYISLIMCGRYVNCDHYCF